MNHDKQNRFNFIRIGLLERLFTGIASKALRNIITASSVFLLVPLFIHAWGKAGYGNWITLTAFVSYLTLLDLGGQNLIGNLLAKAFSIGDDVEFIKILNDGLSLYIFISLLAWVILCGAVLFVVGNSALILENRFILLLMGTAFLITIPTGVYVTVYNATGRLTRGTMLGNFTQAVFLAEYIFILLLGISPVIYAVVYLLNALIGTLILFWDTRRRIPVCKDIKISFQAARSGMNLLPNSLFFWLFAISNALNFQGVLIVLSKYQNPSAVSTFSTHRTAVGLVGYITNAFMLTLWPELSFIHAQKEIEHLRRITLLSIRITLLFSGLASAFIWISLPVIYPIWTGHQIQVQYKLIIILLAQAILASGWNISGLSLFATNNHKGLAVWSVLNGVVTIFLSILLAPHFGLLGVGIATLVGDILCGLFVYPILSCRFLGISVKKMTQAFVIPMLALSIPFLSIGLLTQYTNKSLLLFSGLLIILVCFIPCLWFILGGQDFYAFFHKLYGRKLWN